MEEELLAICKPVLAKQRSDRSHIPPSVELRYLNLAWENYPCERRASFACEALWERLHLDKWSEVADDVREQYAVAGSLKAAAFLRNNERTPQLLKSVLDVLDHVLLMGPGNNVAVARIAAKVHSLLPAPEQQGDMEVVSKAVELQEEVDRVVRPSLSWFRKHALKAAKPWVLVRCLDDWPALEKWKDVKYLLRIAGHRLVPVELGNDYMDESWTQELMSFERFVNGFMLDGGKVSGKKRKEDERECGCRRDNPTRGYMAQHELLNQVQELQADIAIPDYCSLYVDEASDGGEVAVNVWLGPKGTASRMHFDPKNNLLAQVRLGVIST